MKTQIRHIERQSKQQRQRRRRRKWRERPCKKRWEKEIVSDIDLVILVVLSGDSNLPPTRDEETQGKGERERKGVHLKKGGREGGSGEGRTQGRLGRRCSAIQW